MITWIPNTTALPEDKDDIVAVTVFDEAFPYYRVYAVATFDQGKWYVYSDGLSATMPAVRLELNFQPTHWCKLN